MYKTLIKPFCDDIKNFVLDTLFPVTCLSCGIEGKFLCVNCRMQLRPINSQNCIVCQKPVVGGTTHPSCKTPHKPEGLISLFDYHDEKIANAIIKGKYSFLPGIFEQLAEIAAEKIKNNYAYLTNNNFILAPIPLAKSRQRWRGFNQSEVFAKRLGELLNIPTLNPLLRTRTTKTQKDLKRKQRIKNVSDAFAPHSNLKSKILNQKFILVDDVTTTGSTLLEAAQVLKRNGAAAVWCLTVARD